MSAREGTGIIESPLALTLAIVGSVLLFVGGLGVVSFLMRDAPIASPRHRPAVMTLPRSTASGAASTTTTNEPARERPRPGSNERQSASTAVAPVFPGCFQEARGRDPSLASEAFVIARLDTRPGGGTITQLRLGRGGSPFLAACLRQQLVGAGFPAGADGLGEVTWRVRLEGGRAVLVEITE